MPGTNTRFRDRLDAGTRLAGGLEHLRDEPDLLIVGLPRGGVPLAGRVARHLGAPLDVLVVRKVGVPGHEELALGAVAAGGLTVRNAEIVRLSNIPSDVVDDAFARELRVADLYEQRFHDSTRKKIDLSGKTLVIVDDGIATGATITAAIELAVANGARRVVAAAPVAPVEVLAEIARIADEVVCMVPVHGFQSVGEHYDDFRPVTDEEVLQELEPVTENRQGQGDR